MRPKSSCPARLPSIASSRERARELVDVRAGAEDERLAGDDERGPVAALELVDSALERLERGAAEDGRLRVVLAVVDRDERDRPDRASTRFSLKTVSVSDVLPEQRGAHAHADAERGEAVAAAGPLAEPVGELRDQPHAGRGERMAARDRAAVRVEPRRPRDRRRARRTRSAPARRTARSARRGRSSSSVRPACSSACCVAGTGPRPISSGSTPAYAYDDEPHPRLEAELLGRASSEARRQTVAPSVSPAELPAVTRPPARNGVGSVGEPLERRVRAQELVAVGDAPAVVGEDGHRDDGLAHDAVLPGGGRPLLRAHGERVGVAPS